MHFILYVLQKYGIIYGYKLSKIDNKLIIIARKNH
jgi:hypothetical protein